MKCRKIIMEEAKNKGVKVSVNAGVLIVSSLIFPILPLNIIALALIQHGVNKLHAAKED